MDPSSISVSVLLDRCVCSDAEVANIISVPNTSNPLMLLEARKKNPTPWHQGEIEILPTIAKLANAGRLSLFVGDTIREESWRKPHSFPHTPFGDLFHGLRFQHCPAAVNRHVFFQGPHEKDLGEFCIWLVNNYEERWLNAPYVKHSLNTHDIASLNNISRFREICSGLSQKHYDDAFHLWSAEVSGIQYFLTTNRNFVLAIGQNKNLKLFCKPILPSKLLQSLFSDPRGPMPFEYGRKYLLNGTPYD